MRAEKVAWRIAEESGLKLATICAALTTGPEFYRRNPTPTIAYLKGIYLSLFFNRRKTLLLFRHQYYLKHFNGFLVSKCRSARDVCKWVTSNC
jgi:hypothetical protein